MLEGVIDHGTARAARNIIRNTAVAGKTGTSRDGWFVGYTPNLVCAVWVGFDDNKQLGLTGAEAALPIWTEFMKGAVDLRPELGGASFAQPEGITIADVDPETDELASRNCPMHQLVAMLQTQAPLSECFRHGFSPGIASSESEANTAIANSGDPRQRKKSRAKALQASSNLIQTGVISGKGGRKVLVNEMRL